MAESSPVLTLRDLDEKAFPGTALAVLGQPIKHSISPTLHHAALAEMARTNPEFETWHYYRFEVAPADLPQALAKLHSKKFRGLNLTVPHKVLAVDHLAGIEPAARDVGAVNTLKWSPKGWLGHNTDGYGLAMALREDLQCELTGANVLLLGAGGAARGAAVECLRRMCASLIIANRSEENLRGLLLLLAPLSRGIPVRGISPHGPLDELPPGLLVINATSAGLRETDAPPIDLAALPKPRAVYDMIYNPAVTPLLRTAATLGIPCSNGLSMLVHQGARALEIWTETQVPVPAMMQAARGIVRG
jgi:shikimate dehydrogenase